MRQVWLYAVITAATLLFQPTPGHAQNYDVSLDFSEPLHATVTATLAVPDGRIFMSGHAGGYEWSDNIRDLHAYYLDGREIALTSHGPGQWTMNVSHNELVKLRYDVALGFTKQLRKGTQRGGQFFGNALYLVNRALFVMSNNVGAIDVRFSVPDGFKIATPWISQSPLQYHVQDNSELADNTTILGHFPYFEVHEGPFELSVALPGSPSQGQVLLEPVTRVAIREFLRIFPHTPRLRTLFTYFRGVEINGEG